MKTRITHLLNLLCLSLVALKGPLPLHAEEATRDATVQTDSLVSVVKSKGQGETPEKAEKSALLRAVVKAVGALVDQETLVKNDELIRDQILSVSSGFVKSFKVVQEARKNLEGDFETVLEVVVERRKLEKSLSERGLVKVTSNAKNVWAETFSKNATAEDAMRMLEAKLPSLIERLFSVSFFEESPKPVLLSKDSSKNTAKLLWWVKISSDTKFWYSSVAPMLNTCLSAIEEDEKNDSSVGAMDRFAVALEQQVRGSELNPTNLRTFCISKRKQALVVKYSGSPCLTVNVKQRGDLVTSENLNPRVSYAGRNLADAVNSTRGNTFELLRLERALGQTSLWATRGQVAGLGRTDSKDTLVTTLVESKPATASVGGLGYNSSVAVRGFSRDTWPNGEYKFREDEGIALNHQRESLRVLVPEPLVLGKQPNSINGASPLKVLWRAHPAEVAYPVIVDVPIDTTKDPLELVLSLKAAAIAQ
jgi:hypothetical protein